MLDAGQVSENAQKTCVWYNGLSCEHHLINKTMPAIKKPISREKTRLTCPEVRVAATSKGWRDSARASFSPGKRYSSLRKHTSIQTVAVHKIIRVFWYGIKDTDAIVPYSSPDRGTVSVQAHPGHGTRESTQRDHACRHNYMQTKGLHNKYLGYDPMSLFRPFGAINLCKLRRSSGSLYHQ